MTSTTRQVINYLSNKVHSRFCKLVFAIVYKYDTYSTDIANKILSEIVNMGYNIAKGFKSIKIFPRKNKTKDPKMRKHVH